MSIKLSFFRSGLRTGLKFQVRKVKMFTFQFVLLSSYFLKESKMEKWKQSQYKKHFDPFLLFHRRKTHVRMSEKMM